MPQGAEPREAGGSVSTSTGGASVAVPVETVQLAEWLGYHSVWTAEAYGADALSPLAYLAAHTRRIKLAAGVVQIAARTPAATAMHAMTIDALAGAGRTIIGLGVSGPQVVEGWHGAPWGSPTATLRDYVGQSCARSWLVTARSNTTARPSGCPMTGRARWARASRSSRSCARRRGSRSGSLPAVPATWPWPPRPPTAGCPWDTACRARRRSGGHSSAAWPGARRAWVVGSRSSGRSRWRSPTT